MDCLFCKIASGEVPATLRYESVDVLAFDDIHPKAPVHVLVIPRRHIASVQDLTATDVMIAGNLLLAARQVAEHAGLADSGYKLIMNCGRDGGQVVPHVHLHVLGGKLLQGIV